jgi:hypothetical protein
VTETYTRIEKDPVSVRATMYMTVIHPFQQSAIDLTLAAGVEQAYDSAHLFRFPLVACRSSSHGRDTHFDILFSA